MVATFEVVFLIVVVVLGLWWFRRTNLYRARKSGADPGQSGNHRLTDAGIRTCPGVAELTHSLLVGMTEHGQRT